MRHKGIIGDGVAMSNELAGKLKFGKAREEIHQVAELDHLKKKVEVFFLTESQTTAHLLTLNLQMYRKGLKKDVQRVGIFRRKLFMKDSRLRLYMGEESVLVNENFPRDATCPVIERLLILQEHVEVILRDEPFVGMNRSSDLSAR